MTIEEQYEYLVARGFARRIKEALEKGFYPDPEKGKKLVENLEAKMAALKELDKECGTD
tara:strand:- start:19 stop:195 length:177 start_codon:yes stop_codon:yes gene_type:complete